MIFILLLRNDRRDVRILCMANGKASVRYNVRDVSRLNLPQELSSKVERIFKESQKTHQLAIEVADSWPVLAKKLSRLGYSVPIYPSVECMTPPNTTSAPTSQALRQRRTEKNHGQ